ncbi:MAG: SurA N-terminal domain-containing protein [Syntrophomonas sp.]
MRRISIVVFCLSILIISSTTAVLGNVKYPEIVASVGSVEITSEHLEKQIEIEKIKANTMGDKYPHANIETAALREIISEELILQEAKSNGIFVSEEEAVRFLDDQAKLIESLSDEDKKQYEQNASSFGCSSVSEYLKDPKVINATQLLLTKGKIRISVYNNVPDTTDEEVNKYLDNNGIGFKEDKDVISAVKEKIRHDKEILAWENHLAKLVNSGDYEIRIPVDIK